MKHYRANKLARPGGETVKKKDILAPSDKQAIKQAQRGLSDLRCLAGGAEDRFHNVTHGLIWSKLIWINLAPCGFSAELGGNTIPDKINRAERRERQSRELEKNQMDLRASIAESRRLVDEADAMIRRHRDECDTADADGK